MRNMKRCLVCALALVSVPILISLSGCSRSSKRQEGASGRPTADAGALDCALATSSEIARECSVLVPLKSGPMFELLEKLKNDADAAAKLEDEFTPGGGRRPKHVP
jgi:hypothetical protein